MTVTHDLDTLSAETNYGYSAVGMFFRVASSCVRVTTVFLEELLFGVFAMASYSTGWSTTDSIILLNSAATFASKSDSILYTSVNSAKAQRPWRPSLLTPGIQ
jgi:hypothetical protein